MRLDIEKRSPKLISVHPSLSDMNIPRIVLCGTNSSASKTVISIDLMRALRDMGREVGESKLRLVKSYAPGMEHAVLDILLAG